MNFLKANSYKLTANSRGFTLIELLVVIAIIAVLASLSFAGLQNARRRGNDVAMLATMNGIRAEAQICLDKGTSLTNPIVAAGGSIVCTNGASYPTPMTGWSYDTTVSSSVTNGTYTFSATNSITTPTKTISCSENKCDKVNF